jgi:uncharacterized protein
LTGAGLDRVRRRDGPAVSGPQGARLLIEKGIDPVAGLETDTSPLVDQAEEIMEQREQLARQMQEAADHESSQAAQIGMYQ